MIYQLILVLLFEFLDEKDYNIVIIVCMGLFSFVVYFQFQNYSPFYNENLEKLWQMISAINIWTIILLLFALIVEGIIFKGTIFTWFFCLPLILIIKASLRERDVKALLKNTNKLRTPQEFESVIYTLYRLIQLDSKFC